MKIESRLGTPQEIFTSEQGADGTGDPQRVASGALQQNVTNSTPDRDGPVHYWGQRQAVFRMRMGGCFTIIIIAGSRHGAAEKKSGTAQKWRAPSCANKERTANTVLIKLVRINE